jgi:ABC-type dipeptide transport system, periplasmic component
VLKPHQTWRDLEVNSLIDRNTSQVLAVTAAGELPSAVQTFSIQEDKMKMTKNKITRRQLLRLSALAGTGAVIAACAPAAPPPQAPASEATQAPAPEVQVPEVPRNRTVIMGWGASDFDNIGVTSPFAAGHNHQNFNSSLWDPLYYWAAFSDTVYPWLAASDPEYNADYTEVTIKLRDGIEWSDGTPITAKDVAFTVNTWRDNDSWTITAALHRM